MKNLKGIILQTIIAVCALLAASCSKEEAKPAESYFKAEKNNAAWVSTADGQFDSDTLRLFGFNTDGEQHLYFAVKFNGAGKYPLINRQASFYTTVGLDVLTSGYKLDNTKASSITITRFDETNRTISGIFEVYLLKDDQYTNARTPLKFTKGNFRVKLP
jgi:hypothetical protein